MRTTVLSVKELKHKELVDTRGGQPDVFNLVHLRPNTATHTGAHYKQTHSKPDVFNLHLLRPYCAEVSPLEERRDEGRHVERKVEPHFAPDARERHLAMERRGFQLREGRREEQPAARSLRVADRDLEGYVLPLRDEELEHRDVGNMCKLH